MSLNAPSRHFAAARQFGSFRTEADMNWRAGLAGSVEHDPISDNSRGHGLASLRVAIISSMTGAAEAQLDTNW